MIATSQDLRFMIEMMVLLDYVMRQTESMPCVRRASNRQGLQEAKRILVVIIDGAERATIIKCIVDLRQCRHSNGI